MFVFILINIKCCNSSIERHYRLYLNLIFKNLQFYCIVYSVIIFRIINCTHNLFSPESHDELWERIGKLQYVSTLLPLVSVHFKNACRRPVEFYT